MMKSVKAINHIGIAVRSIDAHRSCYEQTLGAVFEGIEDVADQKVRVGFFRVGDVRLELLEPSDPASTIAAFIAKKGEGLHTSPIPSSKSRLESPSSKRPVCG
jgi:methylmalonyl-CoA/ethylmalonyl-CoA epimerase